MKYVIFLAIFLLLAITAGVFIHQDPGYLLLRYGITQVETSLAVALVVLVVGFILAYALFRTLGLLTRTPQLWRRHRLRRREQRAIRSLSIGMRALLEGQWERAERLFIREAGRSPAPWLHYLFAAQAAQHRNVRESRDAYLKSALESHPDAEIAVELLRVELLRDQGQRELALATLKRLLTIAPKQPQALCLAAEIYRLGEDWSALAEALPELRKRNLLSDAQLKLLEQEAWQGLLTQAKVESLHQVWEELPKVAREDETTLHVYVGLLLQQGSQRSAEPLLRHRLNREWSSLLARDYGLIRADDSKQLDYAETWLKNHGRDALLLLTLGRLCVRRKLWGKARIYFESSLGIEPRVETHQALGDLLEQLGEHEAAREAYKAGLNLALPKPPNGRNPRPRLVSSGGRPKDDGPNPPPAAGKGGDLAVKS